MDVNFTTRQEPAPGGHRRPAWPGWL